MKSIDPNRLFNKLFSQSDNKVNGVSYLLNSLENRNQQLYIHSDYTGISKSVDWLFHGGPKPQRSYIVITEDAYRYLDIPIINIPVPFKKC